MRPWHDGCSSIALMTKWSAAVGPLLFAVAAGCAQAELTPASGARSPTAAREERGIRVYADPVAWQGSLVVQRELVPIELVIENRGTEIVYFDRGDVTLVGSHHRLITLAPEQVELAPERLSLGLDPGTPEFLQSQGAAYYHPPEQEQPTAEVRAAAIAEGQIPPGQTRQGFIYFDRLPKDLERAELHVTLRRAPGATVVADIVIPFAVER